MARCGSSAGHDWRSLIRTLCATVAPDSSARQNASITWHLSATPKPRRKSVWPSKYFRTCLACISRSHCNELISIVSDPLRGNLPTLLNGPLPAILLAWPDFLAMMLLLVLLLLNFYFLSLLVSSILQPVNWPLRMCACRSICSVCVHVITLRGSDAAAWSVPPNGAITIYLTQYYTATTNAANAYCPTKGGYCQCRLSPFAKTMARMLPDDSTTASILSLNPNCECARAR